MISWYYLHPEYKKELASRASKNKVYYRKQTGQNFYEKIIDGIDGSELVKEGLAKDFIFRNGELIVIISLLPLIVNKRWNELSKFLNQTKETNSNDLLHLFGADMNNKNEIIYFTNSVFSFEDVALLFIAFEKKDKARILLENYNYKYKAIIPDDEYINAAKLWFSLFEDEKKTLEFIDKAEKSAISPKLWFRCANCWKETFNDTKEINRCFEKALDFKSNSWTLMNVLNFHVCARNWRELFNDTEKARACLESADNIAAEPSDWRECAKSWKELFDDTERAQQYLEKSGDYPGLDYVNCWLDLCNNHGRARKCLEKAESIADSIFDWTRIAEAWETLFNDHNRAQKCLENSSK